MWVGNEFTGDDDRTLKNVQFRLYSDMLILLFSRARDRYLDACRLVEVETELCTCAKAIRGFDHRTIQNAHDLIAAWYRYSRSDGGQRRLGESEQDYDTRLESEWRQFFESEADCLTSSDEFTRALLRAAVFANTDSGYAAEAFIREHLKERYAPMLRSRAALKVGTE